MSKLNIKYKAPVFDKTGLGKASNNIYNMLNSSDSVNLLLEPISLEKININKYKNKIHSSSKYDINFIFSTPYNFKQYIEENKINIGYTMWETDKAHESFIESLKDLDLLLVPCEYNQKVFKKINPNTHVLPVSLSVENLALNDNGGSKNKHFTFYSIYDWTERKGGMDSIESYFKEFKDHVDVEFIIKTKGPFINEINDKINILKQDLIAEYDFVKFPKLDIIVKNYNDSEIRNLHKRSHCYVSLSRGEGWNLPLVDSSVYGNMIISTHPMGATEFFSGEKLFYPIKSKKASVEGMDWFKYMDKSHKWLKPDLNIAQENMRSVYEYWKKTKPEDINNDRLEFKEFVNSKLSPKEVGKKFIDIIKKNLN